MRRILFRALLGVCLLTRLSFTGPHSDPGSIYERLICVVPMVGSGTLDDPRRPMFAPVPGQTQADLPQTKSKGFAEPPQILAFHSVPTDDGQAAIVEFVAQDRAAFQEILRSGSVLKSFDRHSTSEEMVLEELRKFKKDFNFRQLRVVSYENNTSVAVLQSDRCPVSLRAQLLLF